MTSLTNTNSESMKTPERNLQISKGSCTGRALALVLGIFSVAALTTAQTITNPSVSQDEPVELERVVITGSNLRIASAGDQGAVPVDIIGGEDFKLGAVQNVFQALSAQPYFTGAQDNDNRSGAFGGNKVNLRGLGQGFTLTLVNGRRVSGNNLTGANLGLIPFVAVERIEVVKSGASAIYGADALAGVVNVILRERFQGAEIAASYGNTTEYNDGMALRAGFITGQQTERASFVLSGSYERKNSISSLEHPLGRTDDLSAYGGQNFLQDRRNPGIITLPGNQRVMLNSSFGNGATGQSAADYVPVYPNKIPVLRPLNIQNENEGRAFLARGDFKFADGRVVPFAEFVFNRNNLVYLDHRGTLLNVTVPATNFWNPFGQQVSVQYLLDYGTAPGRFERAQEAIDARQDTILFNTGVRGTLSEWDYELAFSDYELNEFQAHDGLSRSKITANLARSDPTALNLFGNAAVAPNQLADVRARFTREYRDWNQSVSGLLRGPLFTLPAGEVQIALGAETRKTGFHYLRDEALATFADSASLTFINERSTLRSRSVDSIFAEANFPLFGGRQSESGRGSLELGAAVRHENFSDFGRATKPGFSLRWEPFSESKVVLRASYSESFYAPSLLNMLPDGDRNTTTFTDPLIRNASGQPLAYSIPNETSGNPNLKPTEGEYTNIGIAYTPFRSRNFTISVDAFRLHQVDAFFRPTFQNVINGIAPGLVERSATLTPGDIYAGSPVGRITFVKTTPVNAGFRRVEGVDINLNYRHRTAIGTWSYSWFNSFTTRFDFENPDGLGVRDNIGVRGSFGPIPRWKSNGTITWQRNGWSAQVVTNYSTSLKESPTLAREVGAYTTTALTLRYAFGAKPRHGWGSLLANTSMSLRVDDLFNEDIPVVGFSQPRGLPSDFNYVNYLGRYVTLELRRQF